ncbi:MAG: pknB 13 [Planctomycetaceae bacterium]|nr:pknB 13 [Planctomycetaceae bacterium]
MNQPPAHLSDEMLSAYLLGKLSSSELEAIEDHLSDCDGCGQRAVTAEPRDEFVDLLKCATVTAPSAATFRELHVTGVTRCNALDSTPSDLLFPMPVGDVPAKTTFSIPAELVDHPRYRILRLLGRGGMGSVWLAEHLVMRRQVALKVIRPELLAQPGALQRFQREVEATATLNHSHIAAAYDAEQTGDVFFLVMEYVPGQPLTELVRRGPLPVNEACRAIRDAATGLAQAHAAGLVHRDVKPGNMLQTPQGVVKVVDFGLVFAAGTDSSITAENIVMGTPDYVSPEQAVSPRAADARSDIYSLGCSLYHLLAGQVPFPGGSMVQKIDGHRYRTPEPLTTLQPALWLILSQMLQKEPAQRIQTALEVAKCLEPFCSSLEPADVAIPAVPMTGQWRRSRVAWAGSVVGLALLALCFTFFEHRAKRDEVGFAVPEQNPEGLLSVGGNSTGSKEIVPVESTPGADSTLQKNDIPNVIPEHRVRKHSAPVRQVVFNRESSVLYSGGDDGWIYAWNVNSGELISRIEIGKAIKSFNLTNDGTELMIATESGLSWLSLANPATVNIFPDIPQSEGIHRIAVSGDGRRAATVSQEKGLARVWDTRRHTLERSWSAANSGADQIPIHAIAWSPDDRLLATAGHNGLRSWNPETGQAIAPAFTQWSEHSLAFSRRGRLLFVAGSHTGVNLFDSLVGVRLDQIPVEGDGCVEVTLDGRLITSHQANLELWAPAARKCRVRFLGSRQNILSLTVSPDGQWLAAGDEDHGVCIWSIPSSDFSIPEAATRSQAAAANFKEIRRFTEGLERPEWRARVVFSPDHNLVYAASNWHPTATLVWNKNTGKLISRISSPREGFGFSLAHNGKFLLYEGTNHELMLATAPEGQVLNTFPGPPEKFWDTAFSPKDDRIAVAGAEGYLEVRDRITGKSVWKTKERLGVRAVQFSCDSRLFLTSGEDLTLWRADNGTEVFRIPKANSSACILNKDATFAISAFINQLVVVSIPDGKILRRFPTNGSGIEAVCLSPDERFVASCDILGDICWWDVNSGKLLHRFFAHPIGALDIAIQSDGKYLLSGGKDGTVRLWEIPALYH